MPRKIDAFGNEIYFCHNNPDHDFINESITKCFNSDNTRNSNCLLP